MSKEVIAIAAALIASLTSLVTTGLNLWFTSQRDFKLEEQRWICGREEEARKNLGLALADLAREVSKEAIRMSWMAWTAEEEGPAALRKELDAYNAEIRVMRPKLIGAATVVAAQSKTAYDKIAALPDEVRELDVRLMKAVEDSLGRGTRGKEIAGIHQSVLALIKRLPSELAAAAIPQSSKCLQAGPA